MTVAKPLMRSVTSAFPSCLQRPTAASFRSAICVCQTSENKAEEGRGPPKLASHRFQLCLVGDYLPPKGKQPRGADKHGSAGVGGGGGLLVCGDVVNESETQVPSADGQPKGCPLAASGLYYQTN